MAYALGPVRSRRLGRSLGIDPIPLKTCNWNCIHCQLGRTVPLIDVRREYCLAANIVAELQCVLANRSSDIDWITFVGPGEPTLQSQLGWLITRVKDPTNIPVAVITNGSLLYRPEVREEFSVADAVLPTLDDGTDFSRATRWGRRSWCGRWSRGNPARDVRYWTRWRPVAVLKSLLDRGDGSGVPLEHTMDAPLLATVKTLHRGAHCASDVNP